MRASGNACCRRRPAWPCCEAFFSPRSPLSPAALAIEGAHRTKIFVVPLENHGSPSLDGLAAGLTEEIMLRLDQLDLYVIATQAHWNRPSKGGDGQDSADHSYVLTGSVRDYAGGTADFQQGIAANGERLVKLFIDASATQQAGYQLYLFYP